MITITSGLRHRIRKAVLTLSAGLGEFVVGTGGKTTRNRTQRRSAKRGHFWGSQTDSAREQLRVDLKLERRLRIQDMAHASDRGDKRLVRLFRRQVTGFPHFCEIKPGR